jgi:hypothetical protein
MLSCGSQPGSRTGPETAAREFVERMQQLNGDPREARKAFDLLSVRARGNLSARATRYGSASGKTILAEAMIVPSRFALRFSPQRYVAQVRGEHAVVQVLGVLEEHRASFPCVLEDGAWRVDLTFPASPALQARPRGGPL